MADTSDTDGPNQREHLAEAQRAAAEGDPLAMVQALYGSGFLEGLVRKIQRGWPGIDADVAVADAVETLYNEVSDGERVLNVGAFLFKVASFKASDEARKRERADEVSRSAAELDVPPEARPEPEPQGDRDARRAKALQLARSLLPQIGTGNVLGVMSYVFDAVAKRRTDLPENEIAEALGLKKATVHVLLHRGFERLERLARKKGFNIPTHRWRPEIRPVEVDDEDEEGRGND